MKYLIVRTAPREQYMRVISEVLAKDPEADIVVLTQTATNAMVLDSASVRIYNYMCPAKGDAQCTE